MTLRTPIRLVWPWIVLAAIILLGTSQTSFGAFKECVTLQSNQVVLSTMVHDPTAHEKLKAYQPFIRRTVRKWSNAYPNVISRGDLEDYVETLFYYAHGMYNPSRVGPSGKTSSYGGFLKRVFRTNLRHAFNRVQRRQGRLKLESTIVRPGKKESTHFLQTIAAPKTTDSVDQLFPDEVFQEISSYFNKVEQVQVQGLVFQGERTTPANSRQQAMNLRNRLKAVFGFEDSDDPKTLVPAIESLMEFRQDLSLTLRIAGRSRSKMGDLPEWFQKYYATLMSYQSRRVFGALRLMEVRRWSLSRAAAEVGLSKIRNLDGMIANARLSMLEFYRRYH